MELFPRMREIISVNARNFLLIIEEIFPNELCRWSKRFFSYYLNTYISLLQIILDEQHG